MAPLSTYFVLVLGALGTVNAAPIVAPGRFDTAGAGSVGGSADVCSAARTQIKANLADAGGRLRALNEEFSGENPALAELFTIMRNGLTATGAAVDKISEAVELGGAAPETERQIIIKGLGEARDALNRLDSRDQAVADRLRQAKSALRQTIVTGNRILVTCGVGGDDGAATSIAETATVSVPVAEETGSVSASVTESGIASASVTEPVSAIETGSVSAVPSATESVPAIETPSGAASESVAVTARPTASTPVESGVVSSAESLPAASVSVTVVPGAEETGIVQPAPSEEVASIPAVVSSAAEEVASTTPAAGATDTCPPAAATRTVTVVSHAAAATVTVTVTAAPAESPAAEAPSASETAIASETAAPSESAAPSAIPSEAVVPSAVPVPSESAVPSEAAVPSESAVASAASSIVALRPTAAAALP